MGVASERLEQRSAEEAEKAAQVVAEKKAAKEGPDFLLDLVELTKVQKAKRFVVTCAQNNVGLNVPFWKAIKRYAKERDALLLVVPVRYRNPTSPFEFSIAESGWWWPKEILPHLVDNAVQLHAKLWLMANLRVTATATNPLSGLQGIARGASTIYGHAQVQRRTIATPQHELPKTMHTTGTVSQRSYSSTKTGQKAEFHHTFGALVVEKDGEFFHMRHVSGDSEGGFYDLDRYYHSRGSRKAEPALALVTGDSHVWWMNPKVRKGTYTGKSSLVQTCRPRKIIFHDIVDSYSVSHHHARAPFTVIAKRQAGMSNLRKELEDVAEFLDQVIPKGSEGVVVASNHHEHVERWLREGDWRKDPGNAELYLELSLAMVQGARMTPQGAETIDPVAFYLLPRVRRALRFLGRRESLQVGGVEVSLHGDKGINGRWGSMASLATIGTKTIIGHSHTPGIEKGCYQVGTSSELTMEYTLGPGSWHNTHCLIFPNGKRQLVNIVNGRFRA